MARLYNISLDDLIEFDVELDRSEICFSILIWYNFEENGHTFPKET